MVHSWQSNLSCNRASMNYGLSILCLSSLHAHFKSENITTKYFDTAPACKGSQHVQLIRNRKLSISKLCIKLGKYTSTHIMIYAIHARPYFWLLSLWILKIDNKLVYFLQYYFYWTKPRILFKETVHEILGAMKVSFFSFTIWVFQNINTLVRSSTASVTSPMCLVSEDGLSNYWVFKVTIMRGRVWLINNFITPDLGDNLSII